MGHRKQDEERIMAAFKRARLNYSEASQAVGAVSEVADLIDDIRAETVEMVTKRVSDALVLAGNSVLTPERLRRLLTNGANHDDQGAYGATRSESEGDHG